MKIASIGTAAFGLATIALLAIVTVDRGAAAQQPAPLPSVAARGFSLKSTAITLPVDEAQYPDGPNVDVVNANCAACHSPSMVLTQPPLSADQWKAEVAKMREVYKAPVADADVPAIVAYLTAMSARLPHAATGKAVDPRPAPAGPGKPG